MTILKRIPKYYSHAIYSDNGGRTWKLCGSSLKDQVNECEVVELAGNRLMNMRNYERNQRTRQVMFSEDKGISWSGQKHDQDLIEPICQASLLYHNNLVFFSNPASRDKREKLSIKMDGQVAVVDSGLTLVTDWLCHLTVVDFLPLQFARFCSDSMVRLCKFIRTEVKIPWLPDLDQVPAWR